jgi:Protein of unknown function (DUF2971)
MRLYYFTNERHGLEAIRDQRLKIAIINYLNDPFEFQSIATNDENEQEKFTKFLNQMSYEVGIICMSKSWQHPLMWSHYAEKHKGICLGFEVDEGNVFKIDYRAERLRLHELGISSLDDLDQSGMSKILSTKYKGWEYEQEYRLFSDLKDGDAVNELYFFEYTDKFMLKEIVLGFKSSVPTNKLTKLLGNRSKIVDCFKSRLDHSEFMINRELLKLQSI